MSEKRHIADDEMRLLNELLRRAIDPVAIGADATIEVVEDGTLYELDIFKGKFSRVREYPRILGESLDLERSELRERIPKEADGGTAFVPASGYNYFLGLK